MEVRVGHYLVECYNSSGLSLCCKVNMIDIVPTRHYITLHDVDISFVAHKSCVGVEFLIASYTRKGKRGGGHSTEHVQYHVGVHMGLSFKMWLMHMRGVLFQLVLYK